MNPLFRPVAGLCSAGLLALAGCTPTPTLPADRVALSPNSSARLASAVTVRVDAIQDSRCPEDVQCVTAGDASVTLSVWKNADSRALTLWLGKRDQMGNGVPKTDSTGVTLGAERYTVLLRDVVPYPNSKQPNRPKQAVVQVTKL